MMSVGGRPPDKHQSAPATTNGHINMENYSSSHTFVGTIELVSSNGLGLMAVVQMAANLFARRIAEIIN